MLSNVLIVYNASEPQSLSDALWYIGARGLNANYVGFNFAATTPNPDNAVPIAQLSDGSITAQAGTFHYHGAVDSVSDGAPVTNAILLIFATYPAIDGIIFSSYTPVRYDNGAGTLLSLDGYLALQAYFQQTGTFDVYPHGRLGCPNGTNMLFSSELAPRAGGSLLRNAVTNAIAAEKLYNKDKPHFLMSLAPAGGGGYGYTDAYGAASLAWMRSHGGVWTVDLSTDYPTLFTAARSKPVDLFALAAPINLNAPAGPAGTLTYSNNYTVAPGGWAAHWWSSMFYFNADFLYNGGSAAMNNVFEPLSDGLRDPIDVMKNLVLSQLSLAEVLPVSVIPNSAPLVPVTAKDKVTVFGDPLYRPYAIPSPQRVSGAPYL